MKMNADLSSLCIAPMDTLHHAITSINCSGKGIALVVDEDGRLLGTITDGDVRRTILAGHSLEASASELLARKAKTPYSQPVTALVGTDRIALLQLMQENVTHQIPLLNHDGRLAALVTWEELIPENRLPLEAVVMAGGVGTRLRPLTEELPKPMLPVGKRPLLELIIDQLRSAGIERINVTTHYKPEKIIEHFGDGRTFGVDLNYVSEDTPLGTAGALGLMEAPSNPLLVINGDILTQVDFKAMLAYHREYQADLTVAVRQYDLQVPYGVLKCDGPYVRQLSEKPTYYFFVNAGIYLLEPSVHRYIPHNQRFDMTDLIETLISDGRPVVSFPIMEYWLDIGQHADYEQAQEDVRHGRV